MEQQRERVRRGISDSLVSVRSVSQNSANNWQMKVDLGGSLKIPSNITHKSQTRHDTSVESMLGIIELTVPSDHRIGSQMR